MVSFAVVIVSYNSSETIISTLESVKAQTYKPLEVIISDDGSKDDTVEVCNKWIRKNEDKAYSIKIVTTSKNNGLAKNFNRGVGAVSEKCNWIKIIAGDDMLAPKCLERFRNFIINNPDAKVIYSAIKSFKTELELINWDESDFQQVPVHMKLSGQDANVQRLYFDYFGMFTMSPTLCVRKDIFKQIKFDERVPMIEDTPFNYNLLHNDIKLYYNPHATVFYRIGDSLSHQSTRYVNPLFYDSAIAYEKYYPRINVAGIIGFLSNLGYCFAIKKRNFFIVRKNNRATKNGLRLYHFFDKLYHVYMMGVKKIFFMIYMK